MKQLRFERNANIHEGVLLSLDDAPLAVLNGNRREYNLPVVLLNIDQYVVFGLSHPWVISRILGEGSPQTLIARKDMAHTLYEHGMKASLGKIRQGNQTFYTALDTFYTQTNESGFLSMLQSGPYTLRVSIPGHEVVEVFTDGNNRPGLNLNTIQDSVVFPLIPEQA